MVSHETSPLLSVAALCKRFATTPVLDDITFHVAPGEIIALLGPSGSGKSTLLRCVAGLEEADQGSIFFRGQPLAGVPVHRRGFGMMFQQFALFPHRTVAENIAFGLRMQGLGRAQQQVRVEELLALVGLTGFGGRSIADLSGGEQQRVALARSLAPRPALLLLDEPLGSLDRALRERLVEEIALILRAMEMTALYVTHDQQEAFAISDRMILLHQGHIVQQGAPAALYRTPNNRFVATFLGQSNQLPVLSAAPLGHQRWAVDTNVGRFEVATETAPGPWLLLRMEGAALAGAQNALTGSVVSLSFRGASYHLVTQHGAWELEWQLPSDSLPLPSPDSPITLSIAPHAISFLAD